MKLKLFSIIFGIFALTAASAASAHVSVDIGLGVGVSPCGYPGVYQDCGYYAPPAAIYVGGGGWGGDRGRGGRRGGGGRGGRGGGRHR